MTSNIRLVLLSKRLWFGLLLGLFISLYIMRKPIQEIDKVQAFLQAVIPANFTQLFNENQVETTPAEEFKIKYAATMNQDYKKRFVLLIPGIGTSHLELWKSKPCFKSNLRSQIWGSSNMILSLISNKQCWLEHMKLVNGTDPEEIKVRVVKDLTSAEYFLGTYWVWGRIVENLINLDYDANDIHAAVYDWRLSHYDLENRDGYFMSLKSMIENKVRHTRLKAVVLTHSMGGLVWFNFLKWVESPYGGNGGDGWVSDHINSVGNVGAPFLGCPKVIAGVLSGEMKDTAQLGPYGNTILESTFTRQERQDLFWSWQGAFSMIPKGGNRVWGNEWISADDDIDRPFQKCYKRYLKMCSNKSFEFYFANYGLHSGAMVSLLDENLHLPIESVLEMLGDLSSRSSEFDRIKSLYHSDFVLKKDMHQLNRKETIRSWSNPLATTLPKMYNHSRTETGEYLLKSEFNKTMKIYCFYGYGKETERKYFYKNVQQLKSNEDTTPQIDISYIHDKSHTRHGVQTSDGDGTVNTLSLAGVCLEAWRLRKYNPSAVPVIVKEFKHEETRSALNPDSIIRGGTKTADHIDILGNYELIEDVLSIAVEPPLKVSSRVRKSTLIMAKSLHLDE